MLKKQNDNGFYIIDDIFNDKFAIDFTTDYSKIKSEELSENDIEVLKKLEELERGDD